MIMTDKEKERAKEVKANKEKLFGPSFLVISVKGIIDLCCLFSLYQWFARLWPHHEKLPFWFAEVIVVGRLLFVSLCFFLLNSQTGMACSLLSILCIVMLSTLLSGTAKILLLEREERCDQKGDFIYVRDVSRWVILIFLNLAEIVLYFSVLYFRIGDGFCEHITDRLTAIYQSLLTFTSLGYGHIYPTEPIAKILVMFQLIYFIIFVFLVAPVVFSAIRVKQPTIEQFDETEEGGNNQKVVTKEP